MRRDAARDLGRDPLYTAEQRARRDASRWTLVQGLLAPAQFLVFLVSLALVLRFLLSGAGYEAATLSILVKTGFLYLIMITGAIWEKVVFGQYLFAPAFFWEDVFSFAVIALHTAYVWALYTGALPPRGTDGPRPRRLYRLRDQCRAVPAQAARRPAADGGRRMTRHDAPPPTRGCRDAPVLKQRGQHVDPEFMQRLLHR